MKRARLDLAGIAREIPPMLKLSVPLAAAELAWMAMGVVDTIMVGPLGPAAIGAGTLGSMVIYSVAISGTGLLLGMDTQIAQSYGAGDLPACRRSLVDGIWLSVLVLPWMLGGTFAALPLLRWFGTNPKVYEQLVPFLSALVWSIIPLFFYTAFRRYLQAIHVVKPVTFAIISANIVNFVSDWALIFGHWGAPAMGIGGSGWATVLARLYMAAVLFWAVARHGGFRDVRWAPDWRRIRDLFRLGVPAALQIGVEAAVFSVVTALAGKLDEASMAAHSVALNVISVTFMVPLGISSAAAVRVGNAVGRKDARAAAASGYAALALSAAFMGTAAVILLTAPKLVLYAYSREPEVVKVGVVLLAIAAIFELFDGSQVVATGALRGVGDTRTPMLAHLVFYWAVGLPIAWILCFRQGSGAVGLWTGMCVALLLIGGTLIGAWHRAVTRLARQEKGASPQNAQSTLT